MKQQYLDAIDRAYSVDANRADPRVTIESFSNAIENIPALYTIAAEALGVPPSDVRRMLINKELPLDFYDSIKLQISTRFSGLNRAKLP